MLKDYLYDEESMTERITELDATIAKLEERQWELTLLDEWRALHKRKEELVEERGDLCGVGVAHDVQALHWQAANNRIYFIKNKLFGTFLA